METIKTYKKLIVNDNRHETRVALLEDGNLAELFIEREDFSDIAGNIYKGRVQRVLPGMQAAFVDIGLEQAAFIYVNDIYWDDEEFEKIFLSEKDQTENSNGEKFQYSERPSRPGINDMIKEGQEMLVHVAKSPIGTKGARVTSNISIPGRYLVLMSNSNHIGVSRRIEDEDERKRLKELSLSLRKEKYGYIIRTAGEGINRERLEKEMNFLNHMWFNIKEKFKKAPVPSLLHKELNLCHRAVRDLLTQEVEKMVIDSVSGYQSVLSFLDTYMPGMKSSVELYEGSEPIFDAYNIEGDISRALKRKVWLKSGSYIIIEQTEALVAIDVNTGRYVGKHNLEETILKTNLEAVKEIAYQIRLRDIGGIIIIDFIDMEKKSNKEKVYKALKDALEKDRSKTHVLPISEMGLIQMTRKRIRKSISRMLCEPCFYCEGEGYLTSRRTICYNVYREILRDSHDVLGDRFTIRVNPEIAELLHGEENRIINDLERITKKTIVIYPDTKFHLEEFNIIETKLRQ